MDALTETTTLPLGIHLNLPAERHHADHALGSSDIKRLYNDPTSYWFSSYMNPSRPEDVTTPGRLRGTAMHRLIFDGQDAFDASYMRGPDQDGMTTAEKTASTKEANKLAAASGREAIKAKDYDQICIAAAMITKNPELQTVFQNGFPEVTIIWERDGLRLKARVDYLKSRGVGDLKSVANHHDIDFREACRKAIANYRYDIQAAHYLEARRLVPQMVRDEMVFNHGVAPHDKALMERISKSTEFAWQWIFFQSEGAPITWSAILSPERLDPKTGEIRMGNPMLDNARNHIEHALLKYKDFYARFGETMWLLVEEPKELMMGSMPGWFAR